MSNCRPSPALLWRVWVCWVPAACAGLAPGHAAVWAPLDSQRRQRLAAPSALCGSAWRGHYDRRFIAAAVRAVVVRRLHTDHSPRVTDVVRFWTARVAPYCAACSSEVARISWIATVRAVLTSSSAPKGGQPAPRRGSGATPHPCSPAHPQIWMRLARPTHRSPLRIRAVPPVCHLKRQSRAAATCRHLRPAAHRTTPPPECCCPG